MAEEQQESRGARIWDLPLRVFHWLLATAVGVSLYTGLDGGFEEMDWHQRSGYLVLGLIAFRLLWGFLGTRHARFGSFLRGPAAVAGYARAMLARRPPHVAGHNPVAALTICVTLLALAVQATTGLFASDTFFLDGPLVHLVESDTVSLMSRIHGWGQWIIGGLVALHLLAIAVHAGLFRERLIRPMITGRSADADPAEGIDGQRLPLALVLAAVVGVAVWAIVTQL